MNSTSNIVYINHNNTTSYVYNKQSINRNPTTITSDNCMYIANCCKIIEFFDVNHFCPVYMMIKIVIISKIFHVFSCIQANTFSENTKLNKRSAFPENQQLCFPYTYRVSNTLAKSKIAKHNMQLPLRSFVVFIRLGRLPESASLSPSGGLPRWRAAVPPLERSDNAGCVSSQA